MIFQIFKKIGKQKKRTKILKNNKNRAKQSPQSKNKHFSLNFTLRNQREISASFYLSFFDVFCFHLDSKLQYKKTVENNAIICKRK